MYEEKPAGTDMLVLQKAPSGVYPKAFKETKQMWHKTANPAWLYNLPQNKNSDMVNVLL